MIGTALTVELNGFGVLGRGTDHGNGLFHGPVGRRLIVIVVRLVIIDLIVVGRFGNRDRRVGNVVVVLLFVFFAFDVDDSGTVRGLTAGRSEDRRRWRFVRFVRGFSADFSGRWTVVRLHVRHDPGRGLIHQQGEDGLDVGDGRCGCGGRDRAFGLLRGFRFLRFLSGLAFRLGFDLRLDLFRSLLSLLGLGLLRRFLRGLRFGLFRGLLHVFGPGLLSPGLCPELLRLLLGREKTSRGVTLGHLDGGGRLLCNGLLVGRRLVLLPVDLRHGAHGLHGWKAGGFSCGRGFPALGHCACTGLLDLVLKGVVGFLRGLPSCRRARASGRLRLDRGLLRSRARLFVPVGLFRLFAAVLLFGHRSDS